MNFLLVIHITFLDEIDHMNVLVINFRTHFWCTQKVSTPLESVSVSGRLHGNFRKESQIVMKFSAQFSLINIPVEFEDEPDWTSPC